MICSTVFFFPVDLFDGLVAGRGVGFGVASGVGRGVGLSVGVGAGIDSAVCFSATAHSVIVLLQAAQSLIGSEYAFARRVKCAPQKAQGEQKLFMSLT